MIVQLRVGDPYGDGHEKYDAFFYNVEGVSSLKELKESYDQGVKIVGDNIQLYCQDYEDNKVPKSLIEKLGLTDMELSDEDEDHYGIYSDAYAIIWLTIARAGNPKIMFIPSTIATLDIDGYGLLS